MPLAACRNGVIVVSRLTMPVASSSVHGSCGAASDRRVNLESRAMVFPVQISAANIGKAACRCTDFFMPDRLFFKRCSCVARCYPINLQVAM